MKATNNGVLLAISVIFVSCQDPASLPADSNLPAILLGSGSATTAQSALFAASALSQDGTAWIAYDAPGGGTDYVRITGSPELKSRALHGDIEHIFVELTPDRFVVIDQIFDLTETLRYLTGYSESCRLVEGTPEIVLGARGDVSGEALVVFLQHLKETGINSIISFGQPSPLPNIPPSNSVRLPEDVTTNDAGEPDAAGQPASRLESK